MIITFLYQRNVTQMESTPYQRSLNFQTTCYAPRYELSLAFKVLIKFLLLGLSDFLWLILTAIPYSSMLL